MSEPILVDGIPGAHSDACMCDRCRQVAAAICARNPDGSFFFTDAEVFEMFGKDTDE